MTAIPALGANSGSGGGGGRTLSGTNHFGSFGGGDHHAGDGGRGPNGNCPTLGFVSNLAHSVIKEQEDESASNISDADSASTNEEMDDDELALLGAPWAKEGNLQRKPYWDGPGKRSKQKHWKQYFVVIQSGDLHMFVFGESQSVAVRSGEGVGGGNWMVSRSCPYLFGVSTI